MCIIFVICCQRLYDMSRKKNIRIVKEPPIFTEFKPIGIPARFLDQISLTLDELEAIRLADYEGLSHEEAAFEMEISRSTFSRLIENSRWKIAEFIFLGKLLSVEGGNVHFRKNILQCANCEHMFKINIDTEVLECPECHSKKLINLAGSYGHGKCCRQHEQKKDNRP